MPPIFLIALVLLAIPAIVVGAAALTRCGVRPREGDVAGPGLLVLAAHPDDCAIVAGEMAQVVLARGGQVRVLYLTCGAESGASVRATTRRAEALAAWGALGVPASDLVFLGYPHSDAKTGSIFSPQMGQEAVASIAVQVRRLPAGSNVLLPAAGELHADHRALRAAALQAIELAARPDLVALEAPEYSPYVSIGHMPGAAARILLSAIPLAGRVAGPAIPQGPTFFAGDAGFVLPPDAARLERKRALLRAFTSENAGEVLVRLFGFPDRWRAVAPAPDALPGGFMALDGRMISPGLGACLIALDGGMGALAMALGRLAVGWSGHAGVAGVVVAVLGLGAILLAFLRPRSRARRWLLLCVGCGLVAAAMPFAVR